MFQSLKAIGLLSIGALTQVKADDSQAFMQKLMANANSDSTVDASFRNEANAPVSYFQKMMRLIETEDNKLASHPFVAKDHHNKTVSNETDIVLPEPEPVPVWPDFCYEAEKQPVRNTEKKIFDSNLHFHTDYTRSVVAQVGDDVEPFHLLPDTSLSQIILLKQDCAGCYTLGDRHYYNNTCPAKSEEAISVPLDWFYQIHVYQTNVTGSHHREKFCIFAGAADDASDNCANMDFIATERSQPRSLFLRGNGFFGLGVDTTLVDGEQKKFGALDQLYDAGIIEKKIFGIQTQLVNRTDEAINSNIRFGDYDQSAFDTETHEIAYLKTMSKNSWELPLARVDFHGDDILNKTTKALMNPGHPFIAAPFDEFESFKESLRAAHPDTNLVCTRYDWCYFVDSCENIKDTIDPISFTFGDGATNKTFTLDAQAFMLNDTDYRTNLSLCHLAIVGQKWADSFDQWSLGESFMQRFYVAFDASDPNQLQIGLSIEKPTQESQWLTIVLVVLLSVVVITFLGLAVWCIVRARQEKKKKDRLEFYQAKHKLTGPSDSESDFNITTTNLNDDEDEDSAVEVKA